LPQAKPSWRYRPPLLWIVVPALVLGGAELLVRHTVDRVPLWYGAADVIAAGEPVEFLFVGHSRIGAAVFTPAFEAEIEAATGRRVRALNLGRGETTMVQHYLGVRRLIESHPESFRGVRVFAEAFTGFVSAEGWSGSWFRPAQPWILTEVLSLRDLGPFWRSRSSPQDKLALIVRKGLAAVSVVRRRERLREYLLRVMVARAARRMGAEDDSPALELPDSLGEDLVGANSVPLRVAPPRGSPAHPSRWSAPLQTRADFPAWEGSVQEDLARLLESHGGRLIFCEIPPSPPLLPPPDGRRAPRTGFLEWASARNLPVLAPAFPYDEEDLIDPWHLRPEAAPAYSRRLAQAWVEAGRP
jgi:hypothetical protein